MFKLLLKGEERQFDAPLTVAELASSISEGLARNAICGRVNGKLVDLQYVLSADAEVAIITSRDEEYLTVLRHTCSHILAQAVKRLYPDAHFAIGPAIAEGFYYDFDFSSPVTVADLEKIEKEMAKVVSENYPIARSALPKAEALARMQSEPYKQELIEALPDDAEISFYTQGDFTDLCAGPHMQSTGRVKAFKLLSVTGAYWRGDEKNKMLTRIYGTAFEKKSELEEYLARLEDAKKRDHNKIGRELGYFMTDDKIGQGLPLLMPKGAILFQILSRMVEDEEIKRGYVRTKTPYMAKSDLYKISGHWDHYRDGMFVMGDEEHDDEVFALRPMTCPFQYTIYNNGLKSYRDLPIRYGETSTLFRNESSGEMHGLIRVRQFTISEGHLVLMPSQMEEEFKGCLQLAKDLMTKIGLVDDISYRFSRWDPNNKDKYIGDASDWERAESEMERILNHLGIQYKTGIDEAAFYGPKLDIQIKNVHGKEDTLVTIQIDMFLAEKFDMSYIDENGNKARPYIIHRTSIGCYERTMALILEKYAGALPFWMSPEQIRVISLTDRTIANAEALVSQLRMAGYRVEKDIRSEKVGRKIREAQLDKVPFMLIIGDREAEQGLVSVRSRDKGDLGTMTVEDFIALEK